MTYDGHIKLASCILICFFLANPLAAQQDTASADGLFLAARNAALREDNYFKAIYYSNKALAIKPEYDEIRVFLGRVYTWNKQYSNAIACFDSILQRRPAYAEASLALSDVLYWTKAYTRALDVCSKALEYLNNNEDLLIRKAKILNAMNRFREADSITAWLLIKDKNNPELRAFADRIKDNVSVNKVSISYDYVHFDKNFPSSNPWHLASIDYTRQTRLGSVTGRVNYANRFKEGGLQYEIDAYPKISRVFYSYVNAGYSDKVGVFPQWRAGYSLYATMPAAFEGELGWRYLYFTTAINIFTVCVGKYYKSYLFNFRTYIAPGNGSTSQSYYAGIRYYFGGANDFAGITLGMGISPDDRTLNQLLSIKSQLHTSKIGFDFKHSFHVLHIVSINASWLNQEIVAGVKGNQLQAGIGYQRRF